MKRNAASILSEALQAWEDTRNGIIEEVQSLGSKDFDFRPTPQNRTVGELVEHIMEVSLMMAGELTRPGGSFRRQSYEAFIAEYARIRRGRQSKASLIEDLKSTHADGDRRIRTAGELFMLQLIEGFDGQPITRLAWFYHGIAHEEYHRGQLALYARLLGRVPALTQRISSA
jgi:uncharacterized damage-inducible protein DinB